MNQENETCINCRFWISEFDALTAKQREIVRSITNKTVIPGKCEASYFDSEVNPQRYSTTTMSIEPCHSTDDEGNLLFNPVPIG